MKQTTETRYALLFCSFNFFCGGMCVVSQIKVECVDSEIIIFRHDDFVLGESDMPATFFQWLMLGI